jgi:hypothetical protein
MKGAITHCLPFFSIMFPPPFLSYNEDTELIWAVSAGKQKSYMAMNSLTVQNEM